LICSDRQHCMIATVSLRLLYLIFNQLLSWRTLLPRAPSSKDIEALLLFLWVGSGALRRVRGRSSQVKGACGVAARVRFAPP
jgi:hypothetical protein